MSPLLALALALLLILLAAEAFTNALEHLGARWGLSEGVTGSIFAAVGTALPETVVPLLALAGAGRDRAVDQQVAGGAILGAPLMLSTLTIFLMAAAAVARRGWRGRLQPERSGLLRDLHFFLLAFGIATLAMLAAPAAGPWRIATALLLVACYALYVTLTVRASAGLVEQGHETAASAPAWITRLGVRPCTSALLLQLGAALALLATGARGFIASVEELAALAALPALLVSLLVVPVATELPEKINSILWVRRGRDTLAMGNITGALVFQGTLLPAIGIAFTPWRPQREAVLAMALTLVACVWLRLLAGRGAIALPALLVNGLVYVAYLVLCAGA